VLQNTSGFVYCVSVAGVRGAGHMGAGAVGQAVKGLKRHTDIPIAVGFGIKTPEQASAVARVADAAVVCTALVDRVGHAWDGCDAAVRNVVELVKALADGVRSA